MTLAGFDPDGASVAMNATSVPSGDQAGSAGTFRCGNRVRRRSCHRRVDLGTFLHWIIVFPLYLVQRGEVDCDRIRL
jgi:hypothetical protein